MVVPGTDPSGQLDEIVVQLPSNPPLADGSQDQTKVLQSRLANQGRQLAQSTETIRRQQAQIDALTQQFDRLNGTVTRAQEIQRTNYLNSLPPDQRAQAEINYLKQQVANLQPGQGQAQPRGQQQTPRETPQEYKARRMYEILEEVNTQHGTTFTGVEEDVDHSSESAFRASLRVLAKHTPRQQGQQTSATQQPAQQSPAGGVQASRVMTQFSSPAAPAAVVQPRSTGPVTTESFQETNWNYDSRKGPRANRAMLTQQRDQAAKAAPR